MMQINNIYVIYFPFENKYLSEINNFLVLTNNINLIIKYSEKPYIIDDFNDDVKAFLKDKFFEIKEMKYII